MRAELDVSLRQDGVTGDARAALASALEEVARMTRIVDNLLLLARADGGRLELLTTPADLRAVAERAAATRAATAHGRGVDIRVEGEPVHLAVDRERIEQVVVNLVDNAVRVSPAGGAVTVRVESGPEGAKLTVADAGPGVPAADRERIFARFTRGDPARGRGGGAGLGLAICAEIVQAHGGRIWVEDRSPHGAGFVVLLPGDVAGVAEPVSHPA